MQHVLHNLKGWDSWPNYKRFSLSRKYEISYAWQMRLLKALLVYTRNRLVWRSHARVINGRRSSEVTSFIISGPTRVQSAARVRLTPSTVPVYLLFFVKSVCPPTDMGRTVIQLQCTI